MQKCSFRRTSAEYRKQCIVAFIKSDKVEYIEIATDWKKGKDCIDDEGHWKTGYIGAGLTKMGVYARFQGKEYVVTQMSSAQYDQHDVEKTLKAEYKLMCLADAFKALFDDHFEASRIELPEFYFNFRGAIFGEFLLDPGQSSGPVLTHQHFLAMPLLPCGKNDGHVKKFTGSDHIGGVEDELAEAIHAFAHFVLESTHQFLLLCDLQGLPDKRGVMCLFDPQCHTNTPSIFDREVYWDVGPRKIQDFLRQHVESGLCASNVICQALGL